MGPVVGDKWLAVFADLDCAFQPICNLHTGSCYGYEALVRGWENHFGSIHEMYDRAFSERQVHQLDIELRARAIAKYALLPGHRNAKLFLNVDNRVMEMDDYHPGETMRLLDEHDLTPRSVCFEVSERHELPSSGNALRTLNAYRDQQFHIALDDYGTGFSGLQMLYETQPDLVKIDRFFIGGSAMDSRKRLFVRHVVDMAHLLGIRVVAEGVETLEELQFCRDVGCDLAQGRFIQWPTTEIADLRTSYPEIAELAQRDRRMQAKRLRSLPVEYQVPVRVDDDTEVLIKRFKGDERPGHVVVIDENEEPVGIVTEETMRPYMYSRYGWALLTGPGGDPIRRLTTRAATCDVHAPIHDALGLFSASGQAHHGVLLTENGRYAGFISPAALLRAVHERDMADARDANPLTRLPGNMPIAEYFRGALSDRSVPRAFVYFDFDRFKPFNDLYGFRRGDRAIQIFGDMLRASSAKHGFFVGHIGGDDFVAGFEIPIGGIDRVFEIVDELTSGFATSAAALHDSADRKRGFTVAFSRDGSKQRFSLLSVTAAVIEVPEGRTDLHAEDLSAVLSTLKRKAKSEGLRVAHEVVDPPKPVAPPARRSQGALRLPLAD